MVSRNLFLFLLSSSFGLGAYADELINLSHVQTVRSAGIPKDSRQAARLLPVREGSLYPHLRKRDGDLSVLHLRDSVVLHYGGIIENERTHLANVTVQKPDPDHPLILLEDMDKLTQSIKCTGDKMALEFKDKTAMDYAIKQWDWVNDKTPDYFYLITFHQHEGCGEVNDRSSYKISAVAYDESTLTTTLTREQASWDETAQLFQLQVSTLEAPLRTTRREIARRQLAELANRNAATLGLAVAACNIVPLATFLVEECEPYKADPVKAFATAGKEAIGAFRSKVAELLPAGSNSLDGTIPAPWTFNWGNENDETTILHFLGSFDAFDYESKIACVGCYVKSNPTLNMKITRVKESVDIDFLFQPNFKTKLNIAYQGTLEYGNDINGVAEGINAVLEGFIVGEFLSFLPDVANGPGTSISVKGEVDMNFGFELDTGKGGIALHIGDEISASTPGWETFSIKPIGEVRTMAATMEVSPYVRLGIGLGFEMLKGVFKRGAFIGLEAKHTWKAVVGLKPNEEPEEPGEEPEVSPCGNVAGIGFEEGSTVDIVYNVVIDPITKFVIENVVGFLGFKLPKTQGTIVKISEPEPKRRCIPFSKTKLEIPPRPQNQDLIQEIKRHKINALKGASLSVRGKDGQMIKYRYEDLKCKDGNTRLLPFNEETGGALFAWCDGRAERDAIDEQCSFRDFGCNQQKASELKEEPANQFETVGA
ncbi:hypothetical protein TWF506_003931 [Arthrobotrys conoides]|uniref:DUF7029 domain-containing protein n=1 Tax=Arthrobotrys conoides TaxID=74498 RepID=A0AAN8NC24_9PEZI